MEFTFKGEAKPDGPRYSEGWQDGYDNIVLNKPCPYGDWTCIIDGYWNGYAEGLISGRHEMMDRLCIDHWPPFTNFELN